MLTLCIYPALNGKQELEGNLPLIQIEQVLINLIRNSIDAILSAPENKQGHIGIQGRLTPNNENTG